MRFGRMRMIIGALALAFALHTAASAEERAYRLDRQNAALQFSLTQFGFKTRGAFTDFDAALAFDRERPQDATLSVEIRTGSVEAGVATGAMRRAFDASNHPQIRFVSTRVTPREDGSAAVEGLLTLRGVTRAIILETRINGADPLVFHANGWFRRSAFHMRGWPWASDRVELIIDAPFTPR